MQTRVLKLYKRQIEYTIKDTVYYVLNCDTYDYVMHYLKRKTQVVYPKEGAYILMRLDVFPGKRVGEAGTGSGAFTLCLSRAVGPQGQVYTYEQREDFYKLAEKNLKDFLEFDNVIMYNKSIEEGTQEAVGLGSHETYRKANKKGRKKMLQQLLGQEPEQKDWGRHIEEARAKGLAGPW